MALSTKVTKKTGIRLTAQSANRIIGATGHRQEAVVPAKRLTYDWSATSIRALRRHLDMTQQEMSEELGVRQQTVSDWERGYHQPRGGMARLLTIVAERADFEYGTDKPTGPTEDSVDRSSQSYSEDASADA
jgi:putative transcriptional regulator